MINLTPIEKGPTGRFVCYAYSPTGNTNDVVAALENLGIKQRRVEGDGGSIGYQVTKAEANKLQHQGATFEEEASPAAPVTEALAAATQEVHVVETPIPDATVDCGDPVGVLSADVDKCKPSVKEPERAHHKTSPSSLQAREACTHYEPSNVESDAATAGTRQHKAVELRSIETLPTDEEIAAVTKCIDFTNQVEAHFADLATKSGEKYIHLNEVYGHVDDFDTSAGYLDEAFILGDKAALIDYKFGQWAVEPAENNLQGFAYALGLFKKFPKIAEVTVYFVMPYLDIIESATFTRDQSKDMLLRIQTVVARSREKAGQPTPSFLACYGCANKGSCPALASLMYNISEKFAPLKTPKEFDPMKIADPAEAVKGYQLATIVTSWAQAFKSRVTNLAVENEAFLPQGYRVISSQDRIITDPKKAFQTLLPVLGEETLWGMLKFGISNVEEAVKERAPKGQKTAQAKAVVEMLESQKLIDRDEPKVYLKAATGAKDILND